MKRKKIDRIHDELCVSLGYPEESNKRERNHPGSSDLFNTAASGGGVWGGTAVQVLGGGAWDGCNLLSQTISRFY